ncbi:potassium/sodium hyperpolarization-activated cyclic nucleotide-gated channel 4-like [Schistocerca americana]|uniref:potassium/sodium hyperpolarization-activated cyclic nucleotide-gated channel 4-like n=1 Tax=Schistocerca americana TaxID=7009 RepID=UPI001F4F1138|nr:potassium/sodium hyperpolarization-activated cyclic nucleotide-gated channel 4-like [Schistocerca americana]
MASVVRLWRSMTAGCYKYGGAPQSGISQCTGATPDSDMQLLVASALLLLAGCASARPEAPAQQYGAPDAAPYPPSGWRPEGRQFFLPSRSSGLYAPPPQQYGPPPPPAPTTTEAAETTTTELPTTTAPSDAAADGSRALESGVYYLLQPDGRLQRITYRRHAVPGCVGSLAAGRPRACPVRSSYTTVRRGTATPADASRALDSGVRHELLLQPDGSLHVRDAASAASAASAAGLLLSVASRTPSDSDMQHLLVVTALALLAGGASARPEPEAPYPASGWRPEGRQFFLPASSRTAGLYAPPPQQYGPPATTTEAADADSGAAGARSQAQREPLEDSEAGVYFVLLPDGRLQRIAYAHGPAPATFSLLPERLTLPGAAPVPVDPGYLARFHYQDLLPQGAPVFAYQQAGLTRIA